jgi:hypothetical protein
MKVPHGEVKFDSGSQVVIDVNAGVMLRGTGLSDDPFNSCSCLYLKKNIAEAVMNVPTLSTNVQLRNLDEEAHDQRNADKKTYDEQTYEEEPYNEETYDEETYGIDLL